MCTGDGEVFFEKTDSVDFVLQEKNVQINGQEITVTQAEEDDDQAAGPLQAITGNSQGMLNQFFFRPKKIGTKNFESYLNHAAEVSWQLALYWKMNLKLGLRFLKDFWLNLIFSLLNQCYPIKK